MSERFLLGDYAKAIVISWLVFFQVLFANQVFAACENSIRGINLVPLPTGFYKGAPELNFPTELQVDYYKDVGFNAIRLPIDWDKMQPLLNGNLDARYMAHMIEFLDKAQSRNIKVLVDLHNYGRHQGSLVGSPEVPVSAFKNIWTRLATSLSSHPAVYAYGLMNEPHHTGGLWSKSAQSGVDGIREVDSKHLIYVSGDDWSSSFSWPKTNPEPFVTDVNNKIVYEAHVYFDDNFSGRYKTAIGSTDLSSRVEQRVRPFLKWLKVNGQQGVIGEFGVPMDDPRWLIALTKFLDISDESCTDWFIWAGGSWRDSYELSLEPINGKDRPQIELLRKRLSNPDKLSFGK